MTREQRAKAVATAFFWNNVFHALASIKSALNGAPWCVPFSQRNAIGQKLDALVMEVFHLSDGAMKQAGLDFSDVD